MKIWNVPVMSMVNRKMSVEEFEKYAARHSRCELVRGEVRDLSPAGEQHDAAAGLFHIFVSHHVYHHDLGKVHAA